MKNNRIIALSFLAVSAVCGLASCGGSKKPPVGKPGVNFYATASLITTDDGVQKTNFVNSECADVVVTDEDKLEFGKQDVVITITPKEFFTFRGYEVETWIPKGLPARPYVGLGGPHSPYAYPLQEGVAWTFEDQSTPYEVELEEGQPKVTFYKEKYVITVKKDYFQKNIVIDYGNVATLKNPVYVYNSSRYDELFNRPISGNFSSFYRPVKSASSFAAANKGATVTYSFQDNNNPFSFSGWDTEFNGAANDEKLTYKHFSVKGYTKKGDEKTAQELAKFDPALGENQTFVPTISTGSDPSLSFFIDWKLLAEGVDKGYACKFEDIQVTLGAPTPVCKNLKVDYDSDDITVYNGGFFQYNAKGEFPYQDPCVNDQSFTTYDKVLGELRFDRVHMDVRSKDPNQSGDFIPQYSLIFKVNPTDKTKSKDFFSVKVNNKQLNVDLVYDSENNTKTTNWRINSYSSPTQVETELLYWDFGVRDAWHLVQLNPEGRQSGLPEKLQDEYGKANYYYLYTTDVETAKQAALNISIALNPIPETVKFSLDRETAKLGKLTNNEKACVGKSDVELDFELLEQNTNGYSVTLEGEQADKFDAIYVPNTIEGHSKIRIYSKNGSDTFTKGGLQITLKQEASANIDDDSKIIGHFVTKLQDKEILSSDVTIKSGDTVSTLDFRFAGQYDGAVFSNRELIGNKIQAVTDNRVIEVWYAKAKDKPVQLDITKIERTGNLDIRITLKDAQKPSTGDSIQLKIGFACVQISEQNAGDNYVTSVSHSLLSCVGQEFTMIDNIVITTNDYVNGFNDGSFIIDFDPGLCEIEYYPVCSGTQISPTITRQTKEGDPVMIPNGLRITIYIDWNGAIKN